ncbi:MAG: type VI secretion system tip protein VgrG, partial [Bacteroidota bacterium]
GLHSNETVGRDKTLSIGKNYTLSVGDTQTLTVVKDVKERVGGDHHEEVAKEWAVNAKKIQLVAKDQLVLKVGKAEITLKKNGDITIKGKKINVKGSGDVVIKGSKIKEN